MIIDYQTSQIWGATGTCYKCGYKRLHVIETVSPGPVTVNQDGLGQFRMIKTYTWECAGCATSGPLSNIDNI